MYQLVDAPTKAAGLSGAVRAMGRKMREYARRLRPSGAAPEPLLELEVWMNQSWQTLRGKVWPKHDGRPHEVIAIERPNRLTLHLPSGRTVVLTSKATVINQDAGQITLVSVLPLLKLATFDAALQRVRGIAEDLGILGRVVETVNEWKPRLHEGLSQGRYSTRVPLEPSVDVFLCVTPRDADRTDGSDWFVALDFEGESD